MEFDNRENLDRSARVLATTASGDHDHPAAEPQDSDWVIERIQDSFDSRAR